MSVASFSGVSGPLKWHGGKQYLASRIVALMPPHLHYVEPFAGGLAVLLVKDPEGVSEVVNDLNGDLINFWRVLADESFFVRFQRAMQATPFSEYHWQSASRHDPESCADQVTNATAFFVHCRQSLAGRMQNFAPLSRTRTRRAMNEQVSAWLSAVEGLPEVHARLKRVAILGPHPAVKVIKQQDGKDTLFYLDPPYLHETRATTKEYGEQEMSREQHVELLETILQCKGKVLLSGYPSELYDGMLKGWTRHTFDIANHASSSKEKARETEVLWCNW